jgi:two-component system CheB/CheR fusion protein
MSVVESSLEGAVKANIDNRCRVMMVHSSMEMLSLLANLVRPYGFDLLTICHPDDALKRAAEFMPHAVYLGVEQIGCDGWELAARLRKLPGLLNVMLVGLVDKGGMWQSADGVGTNGFDYYLPAPPRMRDIVAALTTEVSVGR